MNQPAIRTCDGCTLCCKVMEITALAKPRGVWCEHCQQGVGCKICDRRPDECRTFQCMYLVDGRLGPEWKPSKSRIVITPARDRNGLEIGCDPGFPSAWRKEPYYSQIMEWAMLGVPHDGSIMIVVGGATTLVSPDGEFPPGNLTDDDRIVREYRGKWLVGVRVVKADQLDQSTG